MADETKSDTSAPTYSTPSPSSDLKWMLPPNLSEGVQLLLTQVVRTDRLTPEIVELLRSLMAEQQKPSGVADAARCNYLEHCTSYKAGSGPCPRLSSCGSYAII